MLVGALDPLEGALIILPATAVVALAAWLRTSRHRLLVYGAPCSCPTQPVGYWPSPGAVRVLLERSVPSVPSTTP